MPTMNKGYANIPNSPTATEDPDDYQTLLRPRPRLCTSTYIRGNILKACFIVWLSTALFLIQLVIVPRIVGFSLQRYQRLAACYSKGFPAHHGHVDPAPYDHMQDEEDDENNEDDDEDRFRFRGGEPQGSMIRIFRISPAAPKERPRPFLPWLHFRRPVPQMPVVHVIPATEPEERTITILPFKDGSNEDDAPAVDGEAVESGDAAARRATVQSPPEQVADLNVPDQEVEPLRSSEAATPDAFFASLQQAITGVFHSAVGALEDINPVEDRAASDTNDDADNTKQLNDVMKSLKDTFDKLDLHETGMTEKGEEAKKE